MFFSFLFVIFWAYFYSTRHEEYSLKFEINICICHSVYSIYVCASLFQSSSRKRSKVRHLKFDPIVLCFEIHPFRLGNEHVIFMYNQVSCVMHTLYHCRAPNGWRSQRLTKRPQVKINRFFYPLDHKANEN